MVLKEHAFDVIVEVAQPGKVVRKSHLYTMVVHFLESIICELDQHLWQGFRSSLDSNNNLFIVAVIANACF